MRTRLPFLALLEAIAALAVLWIGYAGALRADEPLRWKFEVGEKLNYNMVQDMNVAVGEQVIAKMHQEMDMIWDVEGVDTATGEAVINQKFDHIKLKLTSPRGNIDYDSKEDKVPTGLEAQIAPLYKAISQGDFELTVTSRGEIKDAKIPKEVLAALKTLADSTAGASTQKETKKDGTAGSDQDLSNSPFGDYATESGFKKMISKSVFVLPKDAPKQGEASKTSVQLTNNDGDKQVVESSYTYEGTKDANGVTLAVFKPQLTLSFADGGGAGKSTIEQQSSDGEALFDIAKGRLRSMKLEQHVTINSTSAGQPAQEKLDQIIDVQVSPRTENKEGETKSAAASEPAPKN